MWVAICDTYMLITLSLSHQLSLESPSSSSGADESARFDLLPASGHVQLLRYMSTLPYIVHSGRSL